MRDGADNQSDDGGKPVAIFICECGPIIKDAVDLDDLEMRLLTLEGAGCVKRHSMLCSEEGLAWLADKLRARPDHHVVIAGCSPREHGADFSGVCRAAGINPSLLAIANIREQCAWVTGDILSASEKAAHIVRAAVERCRRQEPVEEREIECLSDVMVIGAGIAGLTAAKLLAQAGRSVCLVEQGPAVGGKVPLYGELFPTMECASCMIEPLMDEVMHHQNIEVLTLCEAVEALGFFGNFTVRLKKKARRVDESSCCGCGACREACPRSVPNTEYDFGMSSRKAISTPYPGALPNVPYLDPASCLRFAQNDCDKCATACPFGSIHFDRNDEFIEKKAGAIIIATGFDFPPAAAPSPDGPKRVFTLMEMERLLHAQGPTNGKIVFGAGETPRSIALISCARDRESAPADFCSRVCCQALAKCAHFIGEKLPGVVIHDFSWNGSAGSSRVREATVQKVAEKTTRPFGLAPGDTVRVAEDESGVHITIERAEPRRTDTLDVDMAVMALPLTGSTCLAQLAAALRVDLNERGFVTVDHERLRTAATRVEGIYVAGAAQGPKDIREASAHGAAAAGCVMAALVPGKKLRLETNTCHVDQERCGGCGFCLLVCPYKAVVFHRERRVAEINEVLCRGCGSCAATCPSSAIVANQFTDRQIIAEIDSLM
jgi:heterodisulfide reductase subunit A2